MAKRFSVNSTAPPGSFRQLSILRHVSSARVGLEFPLCSQARLVPRQHGVRRVPSCGLPCGPQHPAEYSLGARNFKTPLSGSMKSYASSMNSAPLESIYSPQFADFLDRNLHKRFHGLFLTPENDTGNECTGAPIFCGSLEGNICRQFLIRYKVVE